MKKFFSLIALVGVFAACQPEELKTVFESRNAELSITVKEVINSVTGDPVALTDVHFNQANPYTVTGQPDIPANVVTLSATYNGATGSTTVSYPHIYADTDPVNMDATIHIKGSIGDYEISCAPKTPSQDTQKEYMLKMAKEHGYSHNGSMWLENANDYMLVDTYTYPVYSGEEMGNLNVIEKTFEAVVKANAEAHNSGITSHDETGTITVSAWALYNVKAIETTSVTTWEVKAEAKNGAPTVGENGLIGTFKVTTKVLTPDPIEIAHPSHASHYEKGAGRGTHGGGSNAGGGLALAD